jgi:hypothetical protein
VRRNYSSKNRNYKEKYNYGWGLLTRIYHAKIKLLLIFLDISHLKHTFYRAKMFLKRRLYIKSIFKDKCFINIFNFLHDNVIVNLNHRPSIVPDITNTFIIIIQFTNPVFNNNMFKANS